MTNKKVKTVDEAVKEIVEGKKQNIELQESRYNPETGEYDMLTVQKHEDIAGYNVGANFIAVMTKDGATFVYMVKNYDRIYHYNV